MKRTAGIVGLALLASQSLFAQDSLAIKYANTITVKNLKSHLSILASDSLEGRETGTRGQKMAADYIKNYFEELGLRPVAKDGNSYYQTFKLQRRTWGDIYLAANGKQYKNFSDVLYYGSADVKDEKKLEAVFVGEGNEADYENLDVKGKAVVIWNIKDEDWRIKLNTARKKGAEAFLITDGKDEKEFKASINNIRIFVEKPRLTFEKQEEQKNDGVALFFISPEVAAQLFNTEREKLEKAVAKRANGKERALKKIEPTTLSFIAQRIVDEIETENVLGYLEGTDLKDELIVVTAHYDHLGKTSNGDIYNGADDDGSGTSTVLELAEAFVKAKKDENGPRRSILFMTVTAEEKGLLGSKYYVENPVLPLEKTVANLNIDMVGRVDEKYTDNPNYIYVIGSDKLSTELHHINELANKTYTNLTLDYTYNDDNDPNRYYYRSDHYNFAKNNIPVVFYFSGTHEDYHQATDTIDKINFEKMEKIGHLIFHTAWELVNRDKRIIVDKAKNRQ